MKKILLGLSVVLALVCVLAVAAFATEYKIPVADGWQGPTGAIKGDTASGWEASGFADIDNHVSFSRGENDVWVQIATNSTTNLKSGKYNLTYGNGYRAYFNEYEKKVVMVATGALHSQLSAYKSQSTPTALMTTAKNYALYDKLYNLFALEYIFTQDAYKNVEVPGLGMTWSEYMASKVGTADIYSTAFPANAVNSNIDTITSYAIITMERAIANALYTSYSENDTYKTAFAEHGNPSTLTGATYNPTDTATGDGKAYGTVQKQKSRALLTGLMLHASSLGAGDTSAIAAAAQNYAAEKAITYYLAKGSGGSFGWSGGAENYFGDGGYVAMAFLVNSKTSENANVGCLSPYIETLEIRNSSTSVRQLQNIGSVFISFDDVTTVLLDTTISAIYSEGSTSEDRALFRQMDSLTTVAHVAFNKNGGYTGDVKEGVFDFSGFTETKNSKNIYIGHIGRKSESIKEAVLFKTLMLSGADYSGVIQNYTLNGATALTKVTVPANASTPLTEIKSYAFGDTGLKEIYVLRSVAEGFKVDSSAFSGCSKVTMYVLDKTSAINAIAGFKAGNVKNVSVEIYNPLANAVSFEGALVKMTDFETASADKLAIRFQFVWEEKGAAAKANIAANYTFKGIGIIASTAATYDNYETAVQNETGLASASLVAQEMLEASAGDNSKIVNVLITNADFTDGRRTFLKGYDAESGYYPFCLSLYGMTGDQITAEYYVSAYTVWEDAAGNTYYTFTGIDYTRDGEAKNAISLYDTTLGLVKRGLINGSDYATEDLADRYFYSVLEKGALTTSSFTNHSTGANKEYTLADSSFTYWNVDYRKYALNPDFTGGSMSAGWGFKPDTVEAVASSGVKFSILKDGAKYVVLFTKNRDAAPAGVTYNYQIPSSGRNSQYSYYQPFHYKYGDVSSAAANAKTGGSMTVYTPAVTSAVFNAITTMVVDDGIVGLAADSLADVDSVTTLVLPESCTSVGAYAIDKNANLVDIIWTGDPDAKSESKYNLPSLYDLRGCDTVNQASLVSDNTYVVNVVTKKCVKIDGQLTFNYATNLERYWSIDNYEGYDKPESGVIDLTKGTVGSVDKGYFNAGDKITTIIIPSSLKARHNTFTSGEDDRSYRVLGRYAYNYVLTGTSSNFTDSMKQFITDLHAGAKTAQAANCDNMSINGTSVRELWPELFQ